MTTESKQYKCDSCGAALDIPVDSTVLICRYCGSKEIINAPKTIVKTKVETRYVQTPSRNTGSIAFIAVSIGLIAVGTLGYFGYKSFGDTMKEINKSLPANFQKEMDSTMQVLEKTADSLKQKNSSLK